MTAPGADISFMCLPDVKSIGNWNSRPTATRLRDISVPGTGHEFHAKMSSKIASRAMQGLSLSLTIIFKPLFRYRLMGSTSMGS